MRIRSSGSFLAGEGRNLQADAGIKLFQNIMDMAFYGECGDMRTSGDFFFTQALGNRIDDFHFTVSQSD